MIVDTSAVMSILLEEPGYQDLAREIAAEQSYISAATLVELSAVAMHRLPPYGHRDCTRVLQALNVKVLPFTDEQANLAARAYQEYVKGSGHPAALNLGDVYSYAAAMDMDQRLAFVGEDFTHTDVRY